MWIIGEGAAVSTRPFGTTARTFLIGLGVLVGLLALPGVLWIFSLANFGSRKECSFGAANNNDYRRLLSEAEAQPWTVWPGLSSGVFFPSDRGFRVPSSSFESGLNIQLLTHIRELIGADQSIDRQLAGAHAAMSSVGAEYVNVSEIADVGRPGFSHVYFTYFLPTIRFAPECFICLVWWDTTIDIIFSHDVGADQYELKATNVMSANLKYHPDKESARNVPKGECPAFPKLR
jgi:hypothetical protein